MIAANNDNFENGYARLDTSVDAIVFREDNDNEDARVENGGEGRRMRRTINLGENVAFSVKIHD